LNDLEIRVESDLRSEKVGYKIREAQLKKVPYMLIVGDKEVEDSNVSVRDRKDGDIGTMKLESFVERIMDEIKNKVNR
ncbi:MAG TPA: threonine--tRNA ligase, partial [Clostridiales bacterium]|nr:threonine--tRNA ligase [Clostridiales bacterium]